MTPSEQRAFYAEALQVRDIGSDEVDLVFEAEGIDMNSATIEECKGAIVKWQFIKAVNPWTWVTDVDGLIEVLREIRQEQPE
jgi:hypothetical protein